MQKIQVLFPEPQMRRLRERARLEDRPLSELIRRATERWLDSTPPEPAERAPRRAPSFHGGKVRVGPERLRDLAQADRTLPPGGAHA